MQQTFDLSQLRTIHTPSPPTAWWPLGLGGWLMCGLLLLAFIAGIAIYKRYRRRRITRFALQALQQLRAQANNSKETIALLSILLRRVALSYYPRHRVAGLHGEAWLKFLAQKNPHTTFNSSLAHALLHSPYQAHPPADIEPLFKLAEHWIRALASQQGSKL